MGRGSNNGKPSEKWDVALI